MNPSLLSLEDLGNKPCLGLLGEPGMGKSTALKAHYEIASRRILSSDKACFFDLRAYSTDQRLLNAIFDSPVYRDWQQGSHQLHLFLDSLDECLLRLEYVSAILKEGFTRAPVGRLTLRIACRTSTWQKSLEEELQRLFGYEHIGVFELAPLRHKDVAQYAADRGLPAEAFLEEVIRRNAGPFAARPITLKFLIATYQRTQSLPPTRTTLYEEGCLCLCEETSVSRRDAGRTGTLTREQRLDIASRIAALTVCCNRYGIWTGANLGDQSPEDIPFDAIVGGSEPSTSGVQVTKVALREVLDTGLFSSRGSDRLGWSHQTYAEFLAARYLARKVSLDQIYAIIEHPDSSKAIVPQLHETAAWLAEMNGELFTRITEYDPAVLLRSDVATAEQAARRALVQRLLHLADVGRFFDTDWTLRSIYSKLRYPEMVDDLTPYVSDRSKGVIVRRLAINLAEDNALVGLDRKLVAVALDAEENYHVRCQAASAIAEIGQSSSKASLIPLALAKCSELPDDELKGAALQAAWPDHVSARDLFAALTHPQGELIGGLYDQFLRRGLALHLKPADLPVALVWAEQNIDVDEVGPMTELWEGILVFTLDHLNIPTVPGLLATVLRRRLQERFHIDSSYGEHRIRQKLRNCDGRLRLAVLREMLRQSPLDDSLAVSIVQEGIAAKEDLAELLSWLDELESAFTKIGIAKILRYLVDPQDVDGFAAIIGAAQVHTSLREELDWILRPIEMNSPEAVRLKERLEELNSRTRSEPASLDPPPTVRVSACLESMENSSHAFIKLGSELTLEPTSTHYRSHPFLRPISKEPGWINSDEVTRFRIQAAAHKYLLGYDPEPDRWLGTETIPYSAMAGYRALSLILEADPKTEQNLPQGVWNNIAATITALPLGESGSMDRMILKSAYAHAPELFRRSLGILISADNERHKQVFVLNRLEGLWDEDLEQVLLDALQQEGMSVGSVGSLLSVLLAHESEAARDVAVGWVGEQHDASERAVTAAAKLIGFTEDAGWGVVWPRIQADPEFGLNVLSEVTWNPTAPRRPLGARLDEHQLGDLYRWLVRNVPYCDEIHTGGGIVGPTETLQMFRDSVLGALRDRGTWVACDEIRRTFAEFPELTWLKIALLDADIGARRHTWVPPSFREVIAAAQNTDTRLVRNGQHLIDVLIESLVRLQARLQGETPSAIDVWNELPGNVFRPKKETQVSDYLKRHLVEDLVQRGIVSNREVEIRMRTGEQGSSGERTDIHVDAIRLEDGKAEYDKVSVVVEVKGCWNDNLLTDMEGQLVNRYLRDNRSANGLYVVGWFTCPQWDTTDPRRDAASRHTLETLRDQLNMRAKRLSSNGSVIRLVVLNFALR